jgi:hypothetical protein
MPNGSAANEGRQRAQGKKGAGASPAAPATPQERRAVVTMTHGEYVVRLPTTAANQGDFFRLTNLTPYPVTVWIPPNGMLGAAGDSQVIASRESFFWELLGDIGSYPYAVEVAEDVLRGFRQRFFARGDSAPHVIIE